MQVGWGFTAVARQVPRLAGLVQIPASCIAKTAIRRWASWLAQGAAPLNPGLRARGAQGRRETCCLAGVLPPLGGGPRGSPVWHDFLFVGEPRPPFGDGPHGSRKGQCPLTPDCALCAQGRRETCCLAGVLPPLGGGPRGSPVWHDFLFVGEPRPPFGDGPHGSLKRPAWI